MCAADRRGQGFGEEESTTISVGGVHKLKVGHAVPPRLELIRGPQAPRTFDLSLPQMIIGRGSGCEIQLEMQELSRQHARVSHQDGVVQIQDLNSRNGVLLNTVKVSAARLSEGDQLQLGAAVFIFHEGRS